MKNISVESAIREIENMFHEFTEILDVDTTSILDIICKDAATNQYYEFWSDNDWTTLNSCKLTF